MFDYWLPVKGGPKNGCWYYDGLDLKDGRPVNLGYFRDGSYLILKGEVIWWSIYA